MAYPNGMTCNLRSRAFTLIELLVVIGIIAILAAILFPVFSRAKRAAKQANCISNLKQIGASISLYMNDHDDRFPYAIDPVDKAFPQIWASEPQFQAQIQFMPTLHEVLQPYLKSKDIFKCPSDIGSFALDDQPDVPMASSPSQYSAYQSSYFFRTEIAFRNYTQFQLTQATGVNVLFDAFGHWHGSTGPMKPNLTFNEVIELQDGYRYNVLFGDLHVKNVSFDQIRQAWNISL